MLNAYNAAPARRQRTLGVADFINQVVEIHLQIERLWYPAVKSELINRINPRGDKIAYQHGQIQFHASDEAESNAYDRVADRVEARLKPNYEAIVAEFDPRYESLLLPPNAIAGPIGNQRELILNPEKCQEIGRLFPELVGHDIPRIHQQIIEKYIQLRKEECPDYDCESSPGARKTDTCTMM